MTIRPPSIASPFSERVEIRNRSVGYAGLDVILDRYQQDVGLTVARRDGALDCVWPNPEKR